MFHSFRHNVSTVLRNAEATIWEDWIDAALGHEGTQKSRRSSRYLKRIGVKNVVRTVRAISYSPEVEIGALFASRIAPGIEITAPSEACIKRHPELDGCDSQNWTVTSRGSRNWIRFVAPLQQSGSSLLAQAIAVAADGN